MLVAACRGRFGRAGESVEHVVEDADERGYLATVIFVVGALLALRGIVREHDPGTSTSAPTATAP